MASEVNIMTFRASDGNSVKLEYKESLPSAAALAREYAKAGYPDRYVVFAEKQTVESAVGATVSENEPEKGLYLSCILRPSIFPSQAGCLGALSAVALASALEEHTMQKMGIGWVSDIYCDGVKIGYTSVEGKLDNYTSYEYLTLWRERGFQGGERGVARHGWTMRGPCFLVLFQRCSDHFRHGCDV